VGHQSRLLVLTRTRGDAPVSSGPEEEHLMAFRSSLSSAV